MNIECVPFNPERKALVIEDNPFARKDAGQRAWRPLQMAFAEVMRQIGLQTGLVLVTGNPGSGKTFLADMLEHTCTEMGMSLHRVDRGDWLQLPAASAPDIMLVDDADFVTDEVLEALPADQVPRAKTGVFLGNPSCAGRFIFSNLHPVIIDLPSLSASDVQDYVLERARSANLHDLFAPDALDLLIHGTRGLPRLIKSIANSSYFGAASEGASQICLKHVAYALAAHVSPGNQKQDAYSPRPSPSAERPRSGDAADDRAGAAASLLPAPDESDEDWELAERPYHIGRYGRVATFAGALAALAIVGILVASMLANTEETPRIADQPVSAPTDLTPQALAAPPSPEPPPIEPNEVETTFQAAPVPVVEPPLPPPPETRTTAAEGQNPQARTNQTKAPASLSAEERAAIARGIEMMERSAVRLENARR